MQVITYDVRLYSGYVQPTYTVYGLANHNTIRKIRIHVKVLYKELIKYIQCRY